MSQITIVIPHLDDQDGLARCLHSLADQRNAGVAFDVIVVDNGSLVVPHDLCARYEFVRLEEESTPGPGPARNHGARMANGDILAFIDSDCVPDADWVARIHSHFETHSATDVIGGEVRIAPADPTQLTAVEAYECIYGYRMQMYVERDGYTATCNMATRRDTFREVGDFGGLSIAEDLDWGRRATAMGARIDYVPSMRIATPGRSSFGELQRKWDRHIGHDFTEAVGARARVRWLVRALAIGASPLAEMPVVLRSDRVTDRRDRMLAFGCLVRIRIHRCRRMLGLLLTGSPERLSGAWRSG